MWRLIGYCNSAVASAIAILDPELLVIGGIGEAGPLVDAIRRRVDMLLPTSTEIATSSLGDRSTFLGAVSVALQTSRDQLLASKKTASLT